MPATTAAPSSSARASAAPLAGVSAGVDRVDVLVDGATAPDGETAAQIERIVDQRCGPSGAAGPCWPSAAGCARPPADVTSTSR